MKKKRPRARPAPPQAQVEADYRARLERAKGESTLQLLFKAARLLDERALERAARKSGRPPLRRAHTSLLPHVELTGTRITVLAEKLGISKQAVSQLVDDLEALGVMARKPDPEDARARRVVFTPLGKAQLLEGLALLRSLEEELAGAIGRKRMEELHAALSAILKTLRDRRD